MSFRKDVVSIQLTTFFNVLAGFIYFPILTRIFDFGPDIFGQFQFINSITTIILSFALLSLDSAFISEIDEQNQEQTAIAFSTMVVLGLTVSSLSVISLCLLKASGFLKVEKHFLLYLLIASASLVFERALYALFREKREFTHVARVRGIVTLTHPILGCIFAFFFRNAYVLLLAFSFSHLLGTGYYFLIAKRKGLLPKFVLHLPAIKKYLFINMNTITFQTPSGFFNNFYHNLPIILIRKIFSNDILGYYSLTMRVLGTTNQLLSQGLYETFLPYIAKSEKNREAALTYLPVVCAAFFPPFLFASLLSSWYVPLLFGKSFSLVSAIIRIMTPFYFTQAVVGPYVGFLLVYRRSELDLTINVMGVLLRTGMFFVASYFWGLPGGLLSISLSGMLVYQIFLFAAHRLAGGIKPPKILFSLLPYQALLLLLFLDLLPSWLALIFLIPSAHILLKNRSLFFPNRGHSPTN